jgi:hypothetical protein
MRFSSLALLGLTLLSGACVDGSDSAPSNEASIEVRPRIVEMIAKFEAAPPNRRDYGITKYLLDGKPHWLIVAPCCDQFNYLYNAEGVAVCAPYGGIAGNGDGKCLAGIRPINLPEFGASKE